MHLQDSDDLMAATSIITQYRNSFQRPNGYSSIQWVFGFSEVRILGSLIDQEEAQCLEILEVASNPTPSCTSLGILDSARLAQIRLDNDTRVRRPLLVKTDSWPISCWKLLVFLSPPNARNRAQRRNYRWFGSARVIGVEIRNQNRAAYPEPATEGGQLQAYWPNWLRCGPSVVLVSGEPLRFASEDELLPAHGLPHEVLQPSHAKGDRNSRSCSSISTTA